MTMSNHIPGYLAAIAATVIACAVAVFAANAMVDPMWYFGGNKLGTVNYAFNERLSKVNLFEANDGEYDCVIFGDSRVTLLPQDEIEGYRCFNFAFSAGKAQEAVAYAQYLRGKGFRPDLVIMGVPGAAFRERIGGTNIPSFIRDETAPKSAYLTYLSFDTLSMSEQTLFGESPLDRVYTRNFKCRVAPGAPEYDPSVPIRDLMAGRFTGSHRVKFYDELREIFPEAELVGYVPPISAWAIDAYAKAGWLEDYTKALHLASQKFDRFVDFGVPSALTIDTANTYDGTHYSEPANSIIAASLLAEKHGDALDLKQLSAKEMLTIYRKRLERYRPELEAGLEN
ncbi:hypothetical protein [Parvibaculum sp.]|jgi:hypothetical protein|uniref:hypothetical protein n=2 Tax=Parvibaculum sp. TaxID=2024848 RepID=UPI001B0B8CF0|nr:hypothetical protein [Parvibaculum sp.]MBO6679119.1 hypothetical protein [Parvibaculum sp.]